MSDHVTKNKYKKIPLFLFISYIAVSLSPLVDISSFRGSYAQNEINDADALVLVVNLERIKTQLSLSQSNLNDANYEPAFNHAYITHSLIFPAIKSLSQDIDQQASQELEALLTDIPIRIKALAETNETSNNNDNNNAPATNRENVNSAIQEANSIVSSFEDKLNPVISDISKGFYSQVSVALLGDSFESYKRSLPNSTNSQINQITEHENAIGFLNASRNNFELVSGNMSERRSDEIDSFYNSLLQSYQSRQQDLSPISGLVSAIQRDYNEELSLVTSSPSSNQYSIYFSNIRSLLEDVIGNVTAGDYRQADRAAVEAYLDNYEYLEAPIEKIDPDLMLSIELEMREELREKIQARNSTSEITSFVNSILSDLDNAEELVGNNPSLASAGSPGNITGNLTDMANIAGLSEGFGTFAGETRSMGEAEDEAKSEVRSDIDQIRLKLSDSLKLYQAGNTEGALVTSRSAYLDSYEKIEVPLRPIDPDFTLEMEIRFAELRNLIQSNAPYAEVLSKTAQIREGLDESERLVSGTGVLAPAIAFSTSFSIIFREGLESALIIGAIITYLDASRNGKYKKHVYYGILLAVGATAVTWFIAEFIIELSGASRELIEAIAGISAVAVLFWVSFWILNKIETKRWIEFVKAKVWQATTTGSVLVFVMLSFFTVFREGFETVLFYQAMLSFAKYMEWYVLAGFVLGVAVIVSVAIIVKKLGKRLPLRVLFAVTIGVGAYMSIAFMGNAIREFQEVGYIPTTPMLDTIPRLDINLATMTGIHPTLETVVAQILLLLVYAIGSLYVLVLQPKRKKQLESARKSMSDLKNEGKDKNG